MADEESLQATKLSHGSLASALKRQRFLTFLFTDVAPMTGTAAGTEQVLNNTFLKRRKDDCDTGEGRRLHGTEGHMHLSHHGNYSLSFLPRPCVGARDKLQSMAEKVTRSPHLSTKVCSEGTRGYWSIVSSRVDAQQTFVDQ